MFFGFAAAILSAGAASAYDKVPVPTGDALATAKQTVTSKYYVDTAANSLKDDINNAGSPVKSVTQNGTAVTPDSNGNVAIVAPNWNAASGTAGYIDNKPTFTGSNGQVVTYTATEGTYGAKSLGTAADKDYSTVVIDGEEDIATLASDTGVATATQLAQMGTIVADVVGGKQNKDTNAQEGDIASFNSTGSSHSSGRRFDEASGTLSTTNNGSLVPTSAQVIGYAQAKVTGASQNNIATWDANGNTKDSGKKIVDSMDGIALSEDDVWVPTVGAVEGLVSSATADVSNKQTKSTADYQFGMTGGTWQAATTAQVNALNSGITAAKVSTYDGYADTIASKQTVALEAQGGSETSTVSNSDTNYPSSKNVQSYVAEQIAANNTSTGVANKQDKSGADYQMGNSSGGWTTMTQGQQDALNSGATTTNIAQIATNTTAIAGKQATATANYAVGNTDGTWTSIAKPDTCTSTNPCAWVNNAWVPMAI